MPEKIPQDSVGLVVPQSINIQEPLQLDCGSVLPEYSLAYETYGQLKADRSNAVLICHALSGDQHAAGYHDVADKKPGWWDTCIGPGKPFDTNHFYIVCINNLGGCKGSTGPNTKNTATGRYWGGDFPGITVRDWVASQRVFARWQGIDKWAAVIGGSLGGMQVMQWAIDYPQQLSHAVLIAAAPRLSAQNIAFNAVARHAILSDANYNQGHYYEHQPPRQGLALARMLGHITYLSDEAMATKFGVNLCTDKPSFRYDSIDFEVESYLNYQGRSFVNRFDANTYLLMTRALDYFDPAKEYQGDLVRAFARAQADFLVVSFTSDWRFSSSRSREIVVALLAAEKNVSYAEIEAQQGHDAFLMPIPQYLQVLRAYMQRVAEQL